MVRPTSYCKSCVYSQLKHKGVCHAEMEDRLRSTQNPGGFGSLSAQTTSILSRGAEGVTEQLSHPWRKHREREGKPEQPENERYRSESKREMEGELEYRRNRFTYIVKIINGLVSLVLHYTAKGSATGRVGLWQGAELLHSLASQVSSRICGFPFLIRHPETGSVSHNTAA